jgi:hypothetical protein
MFTIFLNFIYGVPVGAAFALLCLLNDKRTLSFDFITAVLAVVAIVAVGLMAVLGLHAGYYAVFALLVFVGPPIAGFAGGAFVVHGIAKRSKLG